jgi:hypothetical protein
MLDYSDELDEIITAASVCPACDTLVFAYRSGNVERHPPEPWEFMCPRCNTGFAIPESELAFQSLANEWLLAKVHAA